MKTEGTFFSGCLDLQSVKKYLIFVKQTLKQGPVCRGKVGRQKLFMLLCLYCWVFPTNCILFLFI